MEPADRQAAQAGLNAFCADRILRHLAAADQALHAPAAGAGPTRLLVTALRIQHRIIAHDVSDLETASTADRARAAARSLVTMLESCLEIQKSVLLPALAELPGADLPSLVRDMGALLDHDPKPLRHEFDTAYPGPVRVGLPRAGPSTVAGPHRPPRRSSIAATERLRRRTMTDSSTTARSDRPSILCDASAEIARSERGPLAVERNRTATRREPRAARSPAENRRACRTDLDVLIVVMDGTGDLRAENLTMRLTAGLVAWLPRGSSRSLAAEAQGLAYISVHRRRPGLQIGLKPPAAAATTPVD